MMADHDRTMRLLKTARGQIDGIMRMVEEDRYCIDISTQLMATQSLLARVNATSSKPISSTACARRRTRLAAGKEQKLQEIEKVIDKLAK